MSTGSLTSTLLGRNPALSRRLGPLAVGLGVVVFGLASVAAVLPGGGLFTPGGIVMVLALGVVGLGFFAAIATAFWNRGLLASWLFVGCPVAGIVAYATMAGGIRDPGLIDGLLAGGLWGVTAAVTVGTLLFLLGVVGQWIDGGRLGT